MQPQEPLGERDAPDTLTASSQLRAPDWPDQVDQHRLTPAPSGPPADANAYGPKFAWRARLLWAFGTIFQVLGSVLVLGIALSSGSLFGGPFASLAVLAIAGVAFIAAYVALGRGARWPATPSLVLGWSLVVGGLARALLAMADGTLLIPLEVPFGVWLVRAADAPRLSFGRPADWRTVAVTILVIAIESTVFAPYLPAGIPVVDALAAPPEALELTLSLECHPSALMTRSAAAVTWNWHGSDLFGSRSDRLTFELSSASDGLTIWSDSFAMGRQLPTIRESETRLVVNMAGAGSNGTYAPDVQAASDGTQIPPYTVTATYSHGGRWTVVRSATCPA